jgi:transposase
LLKSDEGKTDQEISRLLYISEDTVRNTRLRFCQEGLKAALEDKPHPPRETKLGDQQEAYLVAVACSEPPAGRERWTMELLAQRLLEDGVVTSISPETVRLHLKKRGLNPGA